jgi:hypothetical protein
MVTIVIYQQPESHQCQPCFNTRACARVAQQWGLKGGVCHHKCNGCLILAVATVMSRAFCLPWRLLPVLPCNLAWQIGTVMPVGCPVNKAMRPEESVTWCSWQCTYRLELFRHHPAHVTVLPTVRFC